MIAAAARALPLRNARLRGGTPGIQVAFRSAAPILVLAGMRLFRVRPPSPVST